jgi:hypothetical protein
MVKEKKARKKCVNKIMYVIKEKHSIKEFGK